MTQYKLVVDCNTKQQEYVALTVAEIAEKDQLAAFAAEERTKREAEEASAIEAKASAEAKLAALGLTAEEIAAL